MPPQRPAGRSLRPARRARSEMVHPSGAWRIRVDSTPRGARIGNQPTQTRPEFAPANAFQGCHWSVRSCKIKVMEWKDKAIDLMIVNGPVYLWAAAKAGSILAVGFIAGRWLSNRTMKLLTNRGFEPPVRMLASRLAFIAIVAFAAVIALSNLGFNVMALLTGVGVLGVGV